MRFENAKKASVVDGWHYVDAQGNYALTEHPQRASPGDLFFSMRMIGSKTIAVFQTRKLPAEKRAQIEAARPEWLDAILYAEPSEAQLPPVGTICVEIGYADGAGPELCSFIAATVFVGAFKFVPAVFFVHLWGRGTYEATLEFDYESESWSGEVIVQSLLDDDA